MLKKLKGGNRGTCTSTHYIRVDFLEQIVLGEIRRLTKFASKYIILIEVHQAEKVNGVYVQKLTIHYNCIGSIEIPDVSSLPEPDVFIQTRKGVAVSYSSAQMAG